MLAVSVRTRNRTRADLMTDVMSEVIDSFAECIPWM